MQPDFKRSTFCSNSACVEVETSEYGMLVRDSKNPGQAPLVFTREEWAAFVQGVKAGEFEA